MGRDSGAAFRKEDTVEAEVTLDALKTGRTAVITRLEHDTDGHWRKLVSFGVLPGATVKVCQRWPAFVIRIGMTDVGLDEATARLVSVDPSPKP